MGEVSLSLWLPIGRANFYSGTANGWLHEDSREGLPDGMMVCTSTRIERGVAERTGDTPPGRRRS